MTTSHTSARVSPHPHRIGGHCGSGALRDLLEWAGLERDGPPSEGLVFTLGGALGLSYVRSVDLFPPLYLVGLTICAGVAPKTRDEASVAT